MKKQDNSKKAKRFREARTRYSAKRRTLKWKLKKLNKKLISRGISIKKQKQLNKEYIRMTAPKNFNLVDNTNEVLKYFEDSQNLLRAENNVNLDISEVDILTPPTIALMIANINSDDFIFKSHISGNAPIKHELNKLFTESGFYDHVKTKGAFKHGKNTLLHKEVHTKVVPEIAKEATQVGTRHVFNNENPLDIIYDTLVECMQNTNNHASLRHKGTCYWWLYVYSDPKKQMTSYTFLDLGVGIFNSIVIRNYIKKVFSLIPFNGNVYLVDDLLSGKIGSRLSIDREIRGKGIPQIASDSKSNFFKNFYIIANDVKIDLKSGNKEALKFNLNGTMLYWELAN